MPPTSDADDESPPDVEGWLERIREGDQQAARELVDGNLMIVLPEHTRLGPALSLVHTPLAQRLARVRVFSEFLHGLCEYVVQRAAAHTGLKPIP